MKTFPLIAAALVMGSGAIAQSDMSVLDEHSATTGYPACSSAIVDSCIQLYERGVSTNANLAMNRHDQAAVAMGGPYEPVTAHAASTMSHETGYEGVGGPVEERTSYPPCDPGPGDDSCIQLYERGVTGAGN